MYIYKKLVLSAIFLGVLLSLSSCSEDIGELQQQGNSTLIEQPQVKDPPKNKTIQVKQQKQNCQSISLKFFQTDNEGNTDVQGANYVIIFNPKSEELDFKVSLGLAHKLYAKDAKGKFIKEYIPKRFHEILNEENAKLNGKRPIAAINGDYIDTENKPQGLNISRGVEYSGAFKDKRSSFGISGGKPQNRKATIQMGRRKEQILNYNLVGGNGRFYQNGRFKDICKDLGEYACFQETSRSMTAITSKGYVILLVNNSYEQALLPSSFDNVLQGISENYCLGKIQEGMLFDGGWSTGLYFDNRVYVENSNPMGSVFLIYKK
jgi:hypothetical protein